MSSYSQVGNSASSMCPISVVHFCSMLHCFKIIALQMACSSVSDLNSKKIILQVEQTEPLKFHIRMKPPSLWPEFTFSLVGFSFLYFSCFIVLFSSDFFPDLQSVRIHVGKSFNRICLVNSNVYRGSRQKVKIKRRRRKALQLQKA